MPGKQARALCPVCQEPMPPDETECANCGAFVIDEAVVRLSRAFGINREKALALFEKGFRHPRQLEDRDLDDVLRNGENGLLFLCTNCGGFVATGDSRCPRCEAEFEPEARGPPRTERDILDLVLCPVCGADNDPSLEECEICGEDLKEDVEVPTIPVEVPATCPICGTPKPQPSAPCPACDAPKVDAGLEKVDAILAELEVSAGLESTERVAAGAVHVARRTKVPKVARKRSPVVGAAASRPAPPATAASALARPPGPAELGRSPRGSAAPNGVVPQTPRRARRRVSPFRYPSELAGALVAASALGLYLAGAMGESPVGWGFAVLLGSVSVGAFAIGFPRPPSGLETRDAALLAAGVLPGLVSLATPPPFAYVLAIAGAVPMAFATRRLLRSRARAVLVGASAVALTGFAVALGLGPAAALTPAWILGLVAYAPWPSALAGVELRRRQATALLRRELGKAERDVARNDYDESLRDYDRAIALGQRGTPGGDLPWYGKGATLILLGRYEEALRAIDTALDINPANEVAWLNKGNALMRLGRQGDALRCFEAALRVNPRYEVAWNNRGNALARLGRYEEALRCYERALTLDPGYRGSWMNKGYVLTKLGRYDEAAVCADRAMRIAKAQASAPA